jgi:polysaccharide pyruvyl transferase WcaK-like protein
MAPRVNLILGYYGCNNLGDDLMLYSFLSNSRNAKNYVFLQSDDYYQIPFKFKQIANKGGSLRYYFKFWGYCLVHAWSGSSLIFLGGTQISDNSSLWTRSFQLITLKMTRILGIKSILLRGGIGKVQSLLISQVLRSFSVIIVRDESSNCKLQRLGINSTIERDLVYDLPPVRKTTDLNVENVAITITGSVLSKNLQYLKEYMSVMSNWLDGRSCDLLVFQNPEDTLLLNELKSEFKISNVVILDVYNYTHVLSKYSAIYGSRYHGMVLGNIYGIEVKGIGYDSKTEDICAINSYEYYSLIN